MSSHKIIEKFSTKNMYKKINELQTKPARVLKYVLNIIRPYLNLSSLLLKTRLAFLAPSIHFELRSTVITTDLSKEFRTKI